jgi:hypothetical protein
VEQPAAVAGQKRDGGELLVVDHEVVLWQLDSRR